MRRERITYTGAYRHAMNHDYDGRDILAGDKHKSYYLDHIEYPAKKNALVFLYLSILEQII
jgi:hypothetical protein